MYIAVLEDDPHQGQVMRLWLEGAGHECSVFQTGAAFLNAVSKERFDLFVMDWELPDMTGIDALARVRKQLGLEIPVLFVTVRDSEDDVVLALEKGADDYLSKPLRQREVLARIAALGRRVSATGEAGGASLVQGDYEFDLPRRRITRSGEEVRLTEMEFELALFLFHHIGKVLSRDRILQRVWRRNPDVDTRTVDTHVSRLRKKLELLPENGWRLSPVYRYGYRLEMLH